MAQLATGRYDSILAKLLSMAGLLEISADISPEISPVFVLESDRPEWAFLYGGRLLFGQAGAAGVALQNSIVRFRNPANSNVLATIEDLSWSAVLAARVQLYRGAATADLAGAGTQSTRDSRCATGACSISVGNNVAGSGTLFFDQWNLATSPGRYGKPIILAPGASLDLTTVTQNTDFFGCVTWRERVLGKYER